jgi:hypothetical protein
MWLNELRQRWLGQPRTARRKQPSKARRKARPMVELFEDRITPTFFNAPDSGGGLYTAGGTVTRDAFTTAHIINNTDTPANAQNNFGP